MCRSQFTVAFHAVARNAVPPSRNSAAPHKSTRPGTTRRGCRWVRARPVARAGCRWVVPASSFDCLCGKSGSVYSDLDQQGKARKNNVRTSTCARPKPRFCGLNYIARHENIPALRVLRKLWPADERAPVVKGNHFPGRRESQLLWQTRKVH